MQWKNIKTLKQKLLIEYFGSMSNNVGDNLNQ